DWELLELVGFGSAQMPDHHTHRFWSPLADSFCVARSSRRSVQPQQELSLVLVGRSPGSLASATLPSITFLGHRRSFPEYSENFPASYPVRASRARSGPSLLWHAGP